MGMLGSPIGKIQAVRFSPLPANKVVSGISKLVCTDYCTYALGKNGTVYTTGELAGKVCYVGTGSNYHAIKALKLLGVITADEAERHGAEKRMQDDAHVAYRAATMELEKLTDAGIKLTPGQKAKIASMRKRVEVKSLPYYVQDEAAKKLGLK